MKKLYDTIIRLLDEDPIVIMIYGLEALTCGTGFAVLLLLLKALI